MRQKKAKVLKIVLDNHLVDKLRGQLISSEATPTKPLSKLDIVTSALALSQQWSTPKEECAPQMYFTGSPCGESCVCYTHAIINAALEVLTEGPKVLEATLFLEQEYLCNANVPKILH